MSGTRLPIVDEASQDLPVKISVGRSRFTDELVLETERLKNAAYRVAVYMKPLHATQGWSEEMRIPPAEAMASEVDPDLGISGNLPTMNGPWNSKIGRVRKTLRPPRGCQPAARFSNPNPEAQKAFGRIFIKKES